MHHGSRTSTRGSPRPDDLFSGPASASSKSWRAYASIVLARLGSSRGWRDDRQASDSGRGRDPVRTEATGHRSHAGHPGHGRQAQEGEAPAGDDRRLADARVHEWRGVPHRPVLAGHHRLRAGAGVRRVPLPDVRVADRARRVAVRPGAVRPCLREAVRRPSSTSGRSSAPGCGSAATWTRRGPLGARARRGDAADRRPPSTTWASTAGTCSTPQMLTATTVADASGTRRRTTWSARSSSTTRTAAAWPVLQRARRGSPRRAPCSTRRATWPASSDGVETLVVMLGVQQRAGLRGQPEAGLDPGRLRRALPRAADGGQARVATSSARAPSPPTGSCSSQRLRAVEAQHVIVGDRALGDDRPDRPRHAREGAPALALLPATTRARGSPTTTSTPTATRTSPGRGPGHRLRHRRLQRDDHRLGGGRPHATVSTGTSSTWAGCWTGWPPAATSTARGPDRPGWTPYELPARAARARPGAQHPVLPRRTRGPHRRRAVLPRRGPPHHRGVRRRRPGGHQDHASWPASSSAAGTASRVPDRCQVDFDRLLAADTLVSRPPAAVSNTLSLLGWLDERLDWVTKLLPFVPSPL